MCAVAISSTTPPCFASNSMFAKYSPAAFISLVYLTESLCFMTISLFTRRDVGRAEVLGVGAHNPSPTETV